jgi:TetR/AcrR family fatty acid metabolism transcriptional regulator
MRRPYRRLPRQQRMADILRMARQVFCQRGYQQTKVSEIASRLDIVEGTIFRYFLTKRELFLKAIESWLLELIAECDQELKGVEGTWDRLRFIIWKYLTAIHSEPAMFRLMVQEMRVAAEAETKGIRDLSRRYAARGLAVAKEGIAAGEFRSDVPMHIIRDLIYGSIEHHTWAFLRRERDFSPDAAADSLTSVIFRGLSLSEAAVVTKHKAAGKKSVAQQAAKI